MPVGDTTPVTQNSDGSYTIYNQGGMTVKLTFPGSNSSSKADFEVVTKTIPHNDNGLPTGYTWVVNFGVKTPGGSYLPSVTYDLQGSALSNNKTWYIYYGDNPDPAKNVHAMNGTHHNAPGDPPIGHG